MSNFDRQYRMTAGVPGRTGFEIGEVAAGAGRATHISFAIEKTDGEEGDTGSISIWNLSPSQLAILYQADCEIALKAGYGSNMALAMAATVTYISSQKDGADTMTDIEVVDGRVALRDTYVSLGYAGAIEGKKIVEDVATEMGAALTLSENATFATMPNGFSFVGAGKDLLTKICNSNGLSWSMQNGVIQIRLPNEPITTRAFVLGPSTGMIDSPKRITLAAESTDGTSQIGWEVEALMNCAITVNDYVHLESAVVTGDFRVYRVSITGDNLEGDWVCTFQLMEVS